MMMKYTWKIGALFTLAILAMSTISNDHNRYFQISKNIEIFTNLYKEINTHYVDDLDPARLMRTGVDAMLESLDPYTNYISETEIERFRYITDGKYNGIGAQIRQIGESVTITESYADCPAQKAGLRPGDILMEIDGQSAKGKTADDVSNILKGFPGTEVMLTINRPGTPAPMKVTLVRDEVLVPNVPYQGMVSNDIGYFALTTFTREAGKNVGNALKTLKEDNPNLKGIIFDLRGNGVLIGQRSYGKGLVQNTKDVGYNSKVKMTTAKYYIPSGRCIQGVEYEDGEPKDIPDAERQAFKTRNGRAVLDGGGVAPDVKLKKGENEDVVEELEDKYIIFDYVTQFVSGKDQIGDPKTFDFSEFNEFLSFVEQNKFEYETQTEKALNDLKKSAEKQGLSDEMNAQLSALESVVTNSKKQDLERNKSTIVNLIEKDIASRFHFQKGKIEVGLKNDPEIKEAIRILGDPAEYKKLLGN